MAPVYDPGMRILQIGAGGVGSSAALIAARRDFFEHYLIADYDSARASDLVARIGDKRFTGIGLDASDADAVTQACRAHGITHVLNVVDPRFVMPIFTGAFAAARHGERALAAEWLGALVWLGSR